MLFFTYYLFVIRLRIDDLDFKSLSLCFVGNKVFFCDFRRFRQVVDVAFDRERLSVDFSFDSCGAVRYAVAVFLRADDDFKRDVVNNFRICACAGRSYFLDFPAVCRLIEIRDVGLSEAASISWTFHVVPSRYGT